MISFKCKNCAGEMSVSSIGELFCPFCGSKEVFTDKQLAEYKQYRLKMLEYLRAMADHKGNEADREFLWRNCADKSFEAEDGSDITISYIFEAKEDGVEMYCAKKNVIYIYKDEKSANTAISNFSRLTYPQADIKGLAKYFPSLVGRYRLKDGRVMLAYVKHEDFYPVEMFGSLPAEHVEWILSRMENFCCVLEYNDMAHNGITTGAVFINPTTHEAALLGNWHKVCTAQQGSKDDLAAIRKAAKRLLGNNDAPACVETFLASKPDSDAFTDFQKWDKVIEEGLGGHHFTKFKI